MKATDRILNDWSRFETLYCAGTSYRKIAELFNTYCSTLVQHVLPALKERGLLTKEMEDTRKEGKPIAHQYVLFGNKIRKRNERLKIYSQIRQSEIYPEFLVAYVLSTSNPNSEWKVLKELLLTLDEEYFKDMSHLSLLEFVRDGNFLASEFSMQRMLVDAFKIKTVEEFKAKLGSCELTLKHKDCFGDYLYSLSEDEQNVVYRYYYVGVGRGMTLDSIAGSMRKNLETVRLIKSKAIVKLKDSDFAKRYVK